MENKNNRKLLKERAEGKEYKMKLSHVDKSSDFEKPKKVKVKHKDIFIDNKTKK